MTELGTDNSNGLDQHSGRTRVTPVFRWLEAHGSEEWPTDDVVKKYGYRLPFWNVDSLDWHKNYRDGG